MGTLLLFLVMATYQSFIAVYIAICIIFFILVIENENIKLEKFDIIKLALFVSITFIIAFAGYQIVLKILNIESTYLVNAWKTAARKKDVLKNIYYQVFELQSKQYSLTYESTQTGGYSDIRLQLVSDEYEGEVEESYYAEKPEHYYAKPTIEEVRASSECKPMTDSNQEMCTYGAENVYDGDNRTAWVEGKSDDGVGEYLEIELKEESSIKGILISNGYYKNTDVYYRNNRVKEVKLTFSDGSSKIYELEDNFLETCDIQFDEPVVTSTIKVEILSVYKSKSLNGKKAYDDTCITELEVY